MVVSYTDGHGTAEASTSARPRPVANVNDAPTGAVTITGTATEDQVLTAVTRWPMPTGSAPCSYQWQREAAAASSTSAPTGATYTLGDADVGATIRVVASYTDGHGTAESVDQRARPRRSPTSTTRRPAR